MNAIDTNILVYAVDRDEPIKQTKSVELLDQLGRQTPRPILLWQVAGEFLSCLRKWEHGARITRTETELYINQILNMFPLVMPSAPV